MSPSLVNLDPVLHVAAMGLAVATGPLAWFWLRHRGRQQPNATDSVAGFSMSARGLRAFTLLLLFFTFDLIVFGAFTRLTDSGLGCPDWPGCYGHASPVGAHEWIREAEAAMPTGPVTRMKAWIEMIHRYLATGVGVMIVTLLIAHWREAKRAAANISAATATVGVRLPSLAWPMALLVVVCAQGAFGALTVTMKLFPAIVTLHLLGALLLLGLLATLAARYDQAAKNAVQRTAAPASVPVPVPGPAAPVAAAPPTHGLAAKAITALLVLQIASGGWVSTNYAVMACAEFPLCQGVWWPAMDFANGFTLWRALGTTAAGQPLGLDALTAIHVAHRLLAFTTLAALAWLALRWHRAGLREGRWLGALAALQLLTGLSNVVLQWPLVAALLHTAGAAAMLGLLVWVQAHRSQPALASPVFLPVASQLAPSVAPSPSAAHPARTAAHTP